MTLTTQQKEVFIEAASKYPAGISSNAWGQGEMKPYLGHEAKNPNAFNFEVLDRCG